MPYDTILLTADPLDFEQRTVPATCATCAHFHADESLCNMPHAMAQAIYNATGVWLAEAAVDTIKTRDCPFHELKDVTLRDPVWGGFAANPCQANAS